MAKTSRPAILTTDAASASAEMNDLNIPVGALAEHTFCLLPRDDRSDQENRAIENDTRKRQDCPYKQ